MSHHQALDGVEFCGASWHAQAQRRGRALVDQGYSIVTIGNLLGIAGFEERQIGSGMAAAESYKTKNGIPTTEITQPIEYVTEQGAKNSNSEGIIKSERKYSDSTIQQENAIKEGKRLIEEKPYSKMQLQNELEKIGITHDDALYAVIWGEFDWKEQAKRQARIYVDLGFSIGEIMNKIENDGYDGNFQIAGIDEAREYMKTKN